jgi:hypothetical protein
MEQLDFDAWYDEHQVKLKEEFLKRDDFFQEMDWEDYLIDQYEDYLAETTEA